ncbi:unnamed protein product [Staurois parvus]|uniref:Uncharacterized protein n=1 Tax=Staurois parvus TaxID=386267 RepID=A0ABN9EFJ4_9NEOB|nr:unnamed protein product [Staurois parvus]
MSCQSSPASNCGVFTVNLCSTLHIYITYSHQSLTLKRCTI